MRASSFLNTDRRLLPREAVWSAAFEFVTIWQLTAADRARLEATDINTVANTVARAAG